MHVYMSEITTYMSRWNYNPVLSTFMTNHRLRNKNNTTDTTSGAGADYAFCEHEFIPVFLPFFTFFLTSVRLHYHLFSFVFFNVRFLFYFCFVVVLFACFCMLCFFLFTYYYLFVFVMSFFSSLFLGSGGLFLLFVFISAN